MIRDGWFLGLRLSYSLDRRQSSTRSRVMVTVCWLLLWHLLYHPFQRISLNPSIGKNYGNILLVHGYAIIPHWSTRRVSLSYYWIKHDRPGIYASDSKSTTTVYSSNSHTDSAFNSPVIHCNNEDVAAEEYQTRFRGVAQLYSRLEGASTVDNSTVGDRLQKAVVVVVGLGGVGSWAAEALGRSGIGTLILIDLDDICRSNVNRQLHALSNTIGAMKIDVMSQRLHQINPFCTVHRIHDFVTADNVYDLFDSFPRQDWGNTTVVLDCMDQARDKAALMAYCNERGLPIVTVGSTAGRIDPMKITARDITSVYQTLGHGGDRLLTTVRKELRQKYNFTKGQPFGQPSQPWHIYCVYSEEDVVTDPTSTDNLMVDNSDTPTMVSSFRKCDNGVLGTASFVTGTFGFVAASIVVQGIALSQLRPPCGTVKFKRQQKKI